MKSILFEVRASKVNCIENMGSGATPFTWEINIPLLPAFSVEYLSIKVDAISDLLSGDEVIKGEKVYVPSCFELHKSVKSILVELHYHGLKNYSALFPKVNNPKLRERLGQFYEEAEENFEHGIWLSFTLMCGAIFEGMLYDKLKPTSYEENKLETLILNAYKKEIINKKQSDIMTTVRHDRNLVHASNAKKQYVARKTAMEIRTTLDTLIKDFSTM